MKDVAWPLGLTVPPVDLDRMLFWIASALRCQKALSGEHRSVLIRRPRRFILRPLSGN